MAFLGFIGRFLQWIGRIFKKVGDVADDLMPKIIDLVNNIKNFDTTNPEFADFLTSIIPGDWDDELKAKARIVVPQVLTQLISVKECLDKPDDEALICIVAKIQTALPDVRMVNLSNLAVLITKAMADDEITVPELLGIVQYVFEHNDEP